jgi:hypothetical protein
MDLNLHWELIDHFKIYKVWDFIILFKEIMKDRLDF